MFMIPGLPVIEADPFLQYRPFPAQTDNRLLQHWHEIVGLFVFYLVIQLLSPTVLTALFGDSYRKLARKTKLNFDIHMVSMVQCTLLILLLLPMWNHHYYQNRVADPEGLLFGFTDYAGFVSAVTCGYFLWDVVICLVHFEIFGVGFLFHGFAALWVFGVLFWPYCAPWIPAFLIFELSTPFVNINWFAQRLPAGTIPEWIVVVNGLLLLAAFFLIRIVWGFYSVGLLAIDMFKVRALTPWYLPISNLALNFFLDCLNLFWFSKMLAIARKKLFGKKKLDKLE